MSNQEWTPVTFEHCDHVKGPFYHGTKSVLKLGDELIPGFGSNFQQGRVSNNIYFTARVDTAAWGAELATALEGSDERGTSISSNRWAPSRMIPMSPTSDFPAIPPDPTAPEIRCASSARSRIGRGTAPT